MDMNLLYIYAFESAAKHKNKIANNSNYRKLGPRNLIDNMTT